MTIKANTPILTAGGWMLAGSVQPGDIVFGQDGEPKPVTSVQLFDKGPTYEVLLDDGLTICGSANMRLAIQRVNARIILSKGYNARPDSMLLQEVMDSGLRFDKGNRLYKYSVPTTKPIKLPEKDLPVPPFIVGVWFSKPRSSPSLFVRQEQLNDIIKRFRQYGYAIRRTKRIEDRLYLTVRPSIEMSFLTKYSEKWNTIPDEYLLGSVEQRLELLRGLVYHRPNSFREKDSVYQYFSRDYAFLKRIQGVVESLGIRTAMTEKLSGARYRLFFRTDLPLGPTNSNTWGIVRFKRRFIRKITEIEPSERVYIEANGPFLVGEGFIPAC